MSKLLLERFLVFALCLALPHVAAASSPSKPDTLTLFFNGATENLDAVQEEVARLMEPAGFVVDWKPMADRRAGESFPYLVTVDFRGTCSARSAITVPGSTLGVRSLAST